jgi:rod shape-determining protein MreD
VTTPTRRLAVVLLAAVVLHAAVAPQFRIGGVGADVLLLVAVAAGMVDGPHRGATVGFVAGLLADCFVLTPFGLSALVWSVVGWGVGRLGSTVAHATWWVQVVATFLASAVGVVLFAVAGAVVGEGHLLGGALPGTAVTVGACNAVLSPLAVRALTWALVARRPRGLVLR